MNHYPGTPTLNESKILSAPGGAGKTKKLKRAEALAATGMICITCRGKYSAFYHVTPDGARWAAMARSVE